jgi:prepilin signal peptidase PulO-like enzyme (type II secretory pathway)
MVAGLFCVAAILAAYLSWQDWRTQSIPMLGLLGWLAVSVLLAFYGNPSLMAFCVLSGISLGIGAFQHLSKKMYIGIADLIILTSLSSWIHTSQLPMLFLICGMLGIISAAILKNKRFPFLPALFLSAAVISFF